MQYEIDRTEGQMSIAGITAAAINNLTNDDGFFLMVEGGKIDWSCHANDAATSIRETMAFSDAVQVAIDFYNAHPDETLIIVTGDHETGGLTIGFATTAYATHFSYLASQTMSYEAFTCKVDEMREVGADFDTALTAIKDAFGLTAEAEQDLTLTEDELAKLKAAYELSMLPEDECVLGDAEKLLYGGYDPLTMACSHILNNKAGVDFTSYSHTGLQIPVYAQGVGAGIFAGSYDNTDIFAKTMAVMGLSAN
jgi:alkaline phosphatase